MLEIRSGYMRFQCLAREWAQQTKLQAKFWTADLNAVIDVVVGMARRLRRGRTTLFGGAHPLLGSPKRLIGTVDQLWFCVDVSNEGIAVQS